MALTTKKDSILYLLGALKRLIGLSHLTEEEYDLIYSKLDETHRFVEEKHDA